MDEELNNLNNETDNINELEESKTSEDTQNEPKETPPKKIEVVTGDGDLNISPVYEHLEVEKPKPKENREIFIPEVKGGATSSTESEDK